MIFIWSRSPSIKNYQSQNIREEQFKQHRRYTTNKFIIMMIIWIIVHSKANSFIE